MTERSVLPSLTGTVSPLLTVPTDNASALDYSSLWLPREWKKSTPFVVDILQVDPCGASGLGTEMMFEISKFGHLIFDLCYRWQIPPRQVVGVGPPPLGFAEYVDHLGYAALDKFTINFSSNNVYDRMAYDLYFRYVQTYIDEKRDGIDYLIAGNQTVAQRTALFTNGGELWVDLMLPFSTHFNMALPIVVLSQKTRMTLLMKTIENIVNIIPLGSTTVAPLAAGAKDDFQLWVKVVHLTGNEADMYIDMSRADSGIAYMIHQNVRQNNHVIATTVPNAIVTRQLDGITKPIRFLQWALVPENLVSNTGQNDIFYFAPQASIGPVPPGAANYNPIVSWNITANGQIIQRQVFRNYNRVYDHVRYHDSRFGAEIFEQVYSQYPHSVNAACGYLDYTTLNNPRLSITLGTQGTGLDARFPPPAQPVPQPLRLIINAEDYNFWFLKAGNWSRTFN